jgi:hypothetical protein
MLALMGLSNITKDNHAYNQSTASPKHNLQRRPITRLFAKQRGCTAHFYRQFADVFPAKFCIANSVGESLRAWLWVQYHCADSRFRATMDAFATCWNAGNGHDYPEIGRAQV